MEAPSCLQLWGNALNEFLLDSEDQLSLTAILSKGSSLYSSKDRTEMMDYEDNSDREDDDEYGEEEGEEEEEEEIGPEDYHLDNMLDEDLDWELKVGIVVPDRAGHQLCVYRSGSERRNGSRKKTS